MNLLNVSGNNFKGSNSFIFSFASFLNGGQLLKERICSCRSKFLSLRVDPKWKGLIQGGNQNVSEAVTLWKMAESMKVYRKNSNIGTPRPATVVVLNIKQFYFTMK